MMLSAKKRRENWHVPSQTLHVLMFPLIPDLPSPLPHLISADLYFSVFTPILPPKSAMSTQSTGWGPLSLLPPAESALTVSGDLQKAWQLFSLLVTLGRPAHLLELRSICKLFPAPPELVHLLSQIPDSPIHLRSDLYVTPSLTSLTALPQFLSNLNVINSLPRPLRTERTYFRKRKRSVSKVELLPLTKRSRDACEEVHFLIEGEGIKEKGLHSKPVQLLPLFANVPGQSRLELRDNEDKEFQNGTSVNVLRDVYRKCIIEEIFGPLEPEMPAMITAPQPPDSAPVISSETSRDVILSREENKGERYFLGKEKLESSSTVFTNGNASFGETRFMNSSSQYMLTTNEDRRSAEAAEEELCTVHTSSLRIVDRRTSFPGILLLERKGESQSSKRSEVICDSVVPDSDSQDKSPALVCSPSAKLVPKLIVKSRSSLQASNSSRIQVLHESSEHKKGTSVPRGKQVTKSQKSINSEKKSKNVGNSVPAHERKADSVAPKDQAEGKALPDFESYIVEEEEGSGGYGTVYRAHRKKDGRTVAIKYPHANAHKYHIINELKMLERFGGKNFIIKYEGCFKSGSSDCFVLEHVEHDRPEVLKKEIDVLQLQWYGYCLLKALASLHKQGVVHRDVKPGNFLFSRRANKGYLIDFNLAMDLHQKHATRSKPKLGPSSSFHPLPVGNEKVPSPREMKLRGVKSLDPTRKDEIKVSKMPLDCKSLKRKTMDQSKAHNDVGSWNTVRSQGAEGSGITSARDGTSTRTASAERLREPMPRQGRKELISLLQKTMRTNCEASSVPAPMRKRIAAPPGRVDCKLMITPMPIHSTGIPVPGAGFRSKKGENKKEGPCVGTKGFRAPEVLFRSPHQGPKLDIWSAGVTLLYLIIGKMPFLGDPEQNIKDIAKLRGSEDLWEVAKLHNRECSFPAELYDTQHLSATNLYAWCRRNTRRPDFLEVIPGTFFDLLDKCLTVNPRLRMSAEEALNHEFFAPCRQEFKQK